MVTTVPAMAGDSSKPAQPPKTKVGGVLPVLFFVIPLALSCLVLIWTAEWPWGSILLCELFAAVAGISLGRIFVGKQPDSGNGAAAGPQTLQPSGTPGFAPGKAFFVARAKPLRDRVNELKTQAATTKDKKAAGDAAAAKEPVFDKNILEPEYAIGQGLISREEYNDFRNTYLAQSELSLGLILPLLLIVFGVAIKLENVGSKLWIPLFIVGATWFLFVIAMERRQKYRIELKLLLVSRWDKQTAADKAAREAKAKASDKTLEDAIRKIFQDELKGLHLEVKPLVVEVRKSPEKAAEKKETAQGEPEEGVF
jgi:hypothetical protein